MNKFVFVNAAALSLCLSFSAYGQQMPAGQLVRSLDCSLNEGVTMEEAVEWARNEPRDPAVAPNAIFFRQAIFAGNYRANYDFRMALYYPSYAEMDSRVVAGGAQPAARVRQGVRGEDLFTCHQDTHVVSVVRPVNPDSDAFTGEMTQMTTRFCRLNQGATMEDAYAFAQGVAASYRRGGFNDLMQLYTRGMTPVGDTVAGQGLVIASVPPTRARWAERMDYGKDNNVLEGLTVPVSCDYPMMWQTFAVYRQPAN